VVLDAATAVNLGNFKNAVWGIVEEYFNSGDIPEANRCLSVRFMRLSCFFFCCCVCLLATLI